MPLSYFVLYVLITYLLLVIASLSSFHFSLLNEELTILFHFRFFDIDYRFSTIDFDIYIIDVIYFVLGHYCSYFANAFHYSHASSPSGR